MVGLHPDQATDPIIDIGLALNIPWAIVPCCVFPNFFTYRQLQLRGNNNDEDDSGNPKDNIDDGPSFPPMVGPKQSVRSYDDLCQYIRERHPDIQETTLPFNGRNRVFYWHPPAPAEAVVVDVDK